MSTKTFRIHGREYVYVPCAEASIPEGVGFDVPQRFAGQMVERAFGGFGRACMDIGDPWLRVTDRGVGGGTAYYRLAGAGGGK